MLLVNRCGGALRCSPARRRRPSSATLPGHRSCASATAPSVGSSWCPRSRGCLLPAPSSVSPTGGPTTGSTVKMPSNPGQEIKWGCYLSRASSLPAAIKEAVSKVLQSIGGPSAQPELAIVFVSSIHGSDFEMVIPLLRELVPSLKHVFGCSGYGIVGGGPDGPVEVEGEPGFSLTLGSIPGADIQVLHTLRSSIPPADAMPEDWANFVGVPHDTNRPVSFLTFADPRFAQIRDMVAGLDYAFPNSPKIGAILSAGTRSRSRAMFAWNAVPRKPQRRQMGERLESSSSSSSGRDFYLKQARADAAGAMLKPRPSMPPTTAEGEGEDGPATAALEVRGSAKAAEAASSSSDSSSGSSGGSSSWGRPGSSTQTGLGAAAPSAPLLSSSSSSPAGGDTSTQPDSSSRNNGSSSSGSDGSAVGPSLPARSSSSGSDEDASPSQAQGAGGGGGGGRVQWARSGEASSSSAEAEAGRVARGGGGSVLGNLFNRLVKAPLGGLSNTRQPPARSGGRAEEGGASSSGGGVAEGGEGLGGGRAAGVDDSSTSAPALSWPGGGGSGSSAADAGMVERRGSNSSSSSSSSSSNSGGGSGGGGGVGKGPSSSDRMVSTFKSFFGRSPASLGQAGVAAEDDDSGDNSQGGVYMYGAVLLALHGDVVLDTVTSMGYRAPSPCIWRIEGVTAKNEIVSIVPEALAEGAAEGMGSRGSLLGKGGQGASPRSSLLQDSSDSSDDELEDTYGSAAPEVQAITAVVDMLDSMSEDSMDSWNELLDGAAVAIAADSSKRASDLGPEDWELLPLVDILEDYGVLKVGGSPVLGAGCDLRPGHRLRLMVRDTQGIKDGITDAMLRYKRNDLGAMMSGSELPPTFGTLLLTDVDRGMECYQTPHYESRTAHAYVPAPLSGIFGGAQIGPLKGGPGGGNGSTGILENSAVLGVLRAATDKSAEGVKRQAEAKASVVRQQQRETLASNGGNSDEGTRVNRSSKGDPGDSKLDKNDESFGGKGE